MTTSRDTNRPSGAKKLLINAALLVGGAAAAWAVVTYLF